MECTCLTGVGNTGIPNCQLVIDVTKQLIFAPYFKSDGSINGIDISAMSEIDQDFIDGKIQALSKDDRWYPSPELKNVTDERSDDITEEFEDSTSVFIQEGARTFTGWAVGQAAAFKGQIDKWRCKEVGVYYIDKSGNLIGDESREGFLDPVKIQKDSMSVRLIKGTDTTKQKVQISFIVDQIMDDAKLSYVAAGNITGSLKGSLGLLDAVEDETTSIATTGWATKLVTIYGSALQKSPVKGLELADFSIFNVTQSTSITATSVTEDPDGTYTFVIPAATSADVIRISNKTSGTLDKGYDVNTYTVTIP